MEDAQLQSVEPRQEPRVSLEDCVGNGWNCMVRNFWRVTIVLGAVYTYPLLIMLGDVAVFFYMPFSTGKFIVSMLLGLASSILGICIMLGTYNLQLAVLEGEKISSNTIFEKCTYRRLWNYSLLMLMTGFVVAVGFVCFIVPGFYLLMALQFAPFFIIEKDLGPIEACKASWAITEDSRLSLFYLYVICGFIEWLGGLILLAGVVPAKINTMMVKAYAYRSLLSATNPAKLPYQQPLLDGPLNDRAFQ